MGDRRRSSTPPPTDARPRSPTSTGEHTREILGGQVARSITGDDLVDELARIAEQRGTWPAALRCDNGPELVSTAVANWCHDRTDTVFIDPGCPRQNPWIESFHSRLRDECLCTAAWANRTGSKAGWRHRPRSSTLAVHAVRRRGEAAH
jgi:UDP-N-acetyl-D-mannosaminuronic acid transferase (WecB/TagA/CpsF family)